MVPVRNLYVMLVFAGRDAGLLSDRDVGRCDFDRPVDLLAQLLEASLRRIRKRGLERRYVTVHEDGAAPRGSFALDRTVAQLLVSRGHLAWTADDLLADTPANRVIKAALRVLLVDSTVARERRREARRSLELFAGVADLTPTAALGTSASAPRMLPVYGNALRLARLILERSLPDEGAEGEAWRRLASDPDRMGELFEAFVRGYLAYRLGRRARVHAPWLEWDCTSDDEASLTMLPVLRTDVCVEAPSHAPLVIECKFYQTPFSQHAWGDVDKVRSGHLHQIFTYLRVGERRWGQRPRGLLLYAAAGRSVDLVWSLEGYELRVRSLDMGAEWDRIETELGDLVGFVERDGGRRN